MAVLRLVSSVKQWEFMKAIRAKPFAPNIMVELEKYVERQPTLASLGMVPPWMHLFERFGGRVHPFRTLTSHDRWSPGNRSKVNCPHTSAVSCWVYLVVLEKQNPDDLEHHEDGETTEANHDVVGGGSRHLG